MLDVDGEFGQTKLYLAVDNNRLEEAKKMMKEANDLNIVCWNHASIRALHRITKNLHLRLRK